VDDAQAKEAAIHRLKKNAGPEAVQAVKEAVKEEQAAAKAKQEAELQKAAEGEKSVGEAVDEKSAAEKAAEAEAAAKEAEKGFNRTEMKAVKQLMNAMKVDDAQAKEAAIHRLKKNAGPEAVQAVKEAVKEEQAAMKAKEEAKLEADAQPEEPSKHGFDDVAEGGARKVKKVSAEGIVSSAIWPSGHDEDETVKDFNFNAPKRAKKTKATADTEETALGGEAGSPDEEQEENAQTQERNAVIAAALAVDAARGNETADAKREETAYKILNIEGVALVAKSAERVAENASMAENASYWGGNGGGGWRSRRQAEEKREPEKIEEVAAGCEAFAGNTPLDDSWCADNCGAGFCPLDKCKCDEARSKEKKEAAAKAVREGVAMEDAVKIERVKVDMESKGDVNYPFDKAIIGYWGAGPFTPFEGEKGPSVADALKEGYNVITVSFADTFSVDGEFELHTDMCPSNADHKVQKHHHICALPKWNISAEANIDPKRWRYILSFGGAAGPGPYMPATENLRQRTTQEDQFADGFVKTYHKVKEKYGFDGIDIDVESSLTTPLLSSFRKIFKTLHEEGEIISMAPESPSLNPEELKIFQEGSLNSYVPLVDSTIINYVTFVAPQLYNDAVPFNDPAKYVKSLQAGHTIEWDGRMVEVKVPPSKIVLGHPATEAAAPATRPLPWQNSTEALLALYKSSPELKATKGVMTWSVGHDWSNNWKWVRTVKKIWGEDSKR